MIHIDLFSGIGGFSQGLKEAGSPISKTYFSEIDKYAISVYRRNFPDAEYIGGVESISGSRFKGRKTIITFGFPCQDLSIAGKRRGFDGSRSSLFFEAIRVIKEVKPDIFIFENVKGFYSSNDGKDFQIALQTIADIGIYECEWQLLNTAWFLPQNRERIYFIGHLAGECGSKVFPVRENDFTNRESFHRRNSRCLTKTYGKLSGDSTKIKKNSIVRIFTPVECERLQGFKDCWTKYGCKNEQISDAERYKMLGNAVSVPVVKCIGERLKP